MRFHWSRNRYAQEYLKGFWDKWINKNADYFTKHNPPARHQRMHPGFILEARTVRKLKELSEPNFQISVCERVWSWANSGPRPFRPFRPFGDDYEPIPFSPFKPFSHYLMSRGSMLTESLNTKTVRH